MKVSILLLSALFFFGTISVSANNDTYIIKDENKNTAVAPASEDEQVATSSTKAEEEADCE